jgi:acyl-homoserine-lactone acylase
MGNFVDGRYIGHSGDCHILMVSWDKDGNVYSEAVTQYGSNPSNPSSPHYNDQTPLFVQRKLRKVHFFRDDVLAHAEEKYIPGARQ